ncbi:MAG: hypothetical protein R3E10_10640 [Gemmatimonadota bacterium]
MTECVCTEEFRSVTVEVVDPSGAPVEGLSVVVTRLQDGLVLRSRENGGSGTYMVLDDRARFDVAASGERVRFVAADGVHSVSADFVMATDLCRCHIHKLLGPDRLVFPPS